MRLVATAIVLVALATASDVRAEFGDRADGNPDPVSVPSVDVEGTFEVRASFNGVVITEGGSGGPRCSWRRFTTGEYEDFLDISVVVDPVPLPEVPDLPVDPTPAEIAAHAEAMEVYETEVERRAEQERREQVRRDRLSEIMWEQAGVVVPHAFYSAYCAGVAAQYVYVALDTDDRDLLDEIEDMMRGRIPVPVSDVSPSVEVGGIVNVGMWMAVDAPVVPVRLTAEAGPRWATISANHVGTVFEMGTGERVVCDGVGDPIVDLDTIEESPVCGYTYTQPAPEGGVYELTISTSWSLPWASSSGSGVLTHTQPVVVGYDVDEIQTIGRG